MYDKGEKCPTVFFTFERFEHRFLGFGHRATDAMRVALEFAHADAGAWGLAAHLDRSGVVRAHRCART